MPTKRQRKALVANVVSVTVLTKTTQPAKAIMTAAVVVAGRRRRNVS